MKDQKEYKSFKSQIKSVKQDVINGVNVGIVEGYIAAFTQDRGDDIISKTAFNNTLKEKIKEGKSIPMLYQHDENSVIGVFPIDSINVDDYGIFAKGQINLDVQKGFEAYKLAKQGALSDFSIGYRVNDSEYIKDRKSPGKMIRNLKEIELIEASIVHYPMNKDAIMTMVKTNRQTKTATQFQDYPLAEREHEWDSTAAEQRVREFTGSVDEPSQSYKDAFMWYDVENEDNFGGYKLPYVDVIDGRLYAVPNAIIAIAAVLEGARGGVDIPTDDVERVKNHVEKYYAKMDMEAPFEKAMLEDDKEKQLCECQYDSQKEDSYDDNEEDLTIVVTKSMLMDSQFTKRDLEKVLRESKRFSSRACVTLASMLDKVRVDSNEAKQKQVTDDLLNEIKGLTKIIKSKW